MESSAAICWQLLYTKPHAEAWVEVNLRRQGFVTLLPRVRASGSGSGEGSVGLKPLFPRYVFAGYEPERSARAMRSTRGVLYVVHCGEVPARVPGAVIEEIRGRMDEWGVVAVEPQAAVDSLFAKRERERTRALVKLVEAGWRVRVA
jgi:transcriptional antiterminator RfaH